MQRCILHVIPRLEWGSAERQIVAIARECRDQFDVHVITSRVSAAMLARIRAEQATVHVIPACRLGEGPELAKSISLIRRLRPDVVHCWRLHQTWPIALATRFGSNARLVVDLRLPVGNSEWLNHQGEQWAIRRAHARVTPCQWWRKRRDRQPVHVIPDCVDTSFLPAATPIITDGPSLRQQLGLNEGHKFVLYVGRMLLRKHIDELIWAADLIKVVRDDVDLVVLGTGPTSQRLEQFRHQIQIEDHVRFLGAQDEVSRWMRESQCLWTASELEDVPLAVWEAQAIGLPVVASDIEAHQRCIEPDRSGILVPWQDNAARVRQTIRLLDDPDWAASLADESRRKFQRDDTIRGSMSRYWSLYESLTS